MTLIPKRPKRWSKKYFGDIKRGSQPIPRPENNEPLRTREKRATHFDENIKLPAVIVAYPAPQIESEDAYAVDILMQVLGGGANSRLYKKLVDKDEIAVQAGSANMSLEHTGIIMVQAIGARGQEASTIEKSVKSEIERIKKDGITEEEFQKALNNMESQYINSLNNTENVAEQLATNYMYFKNTNLINTTFEKYKKLTVQDVNNAAKKYLDPSRSLVLQYLPKK